MSQKIHLARSTPFPTSRQTQRCTVEFRHCCEILLLKNNFYGKFTNARAITKTKLRLNPTPEFDFNLAEKRTAARPRWVKKAKAVFRAKNYL